MVLLSLNCFGQGYQLTDLGALTGTNSNYENHISHYRPVPVVQLESARQ